MSSRRETSTSALGRLTADAEAVARAFAAGRSALPTLAMGADPEGVVQVGMDARGDVVRLDLDPHWRDTLTPDALGSAVTDALRQAAEVRTGDWAAALSVPDGGGRAAAEPTRSVDAQVTDPAGPVSVHVGARGATVALAAEWVADVDDSTVCDAVLAAIAAPRLAVVPGDAPRLREVRELERQTHETLTVSATTLPSFMRGPVQSSIDRVHDDVTQALALPLASRAAANPVLREYASGMAECLRLAGRPAGLPEASEAWAVAAVGLTAGLAATRPPRAPMLAWFGRRLGAAG